MVVQRQAGPSRTQKIAKGAGGKGTNLTSTNTTGGFLHVQEA